MTTLKVEIPYSRALEYGISGLPATRGRERLGLSPSTANVAAQTRDRSRNSIDKVDGSLYSRPCRLAMLLTRNPTARLGG